MVSSKVFVRLYKQMLLIREVEEHIVKVYFTDVIKSPVHLSIGQESIAVGVCDALSADDLVSSTYRCHANYIAKGGDLKAMMAELYGKRDGCARGKAGSMHLVDMKHGLLLASAVVGTTIPVAAGYAFAMKQETKKTGRLRVVANFFGDGATEEGCFSETLNFSALHKLPVLFICENNRMAIHTPLERRWAQDKLCERVETYGIRTHKIAGADVFKIREVVSAELEKIRAGEGPAFLECETYRWKEHVGPADDFDAGYRSIEDLRKWQAIDQITALEAMLDAQQVQTIKQEVASEIAEAVNFAENSTFPNTEEELYEHVWAS